MIFPDNYKNLADLLTKGTMQDLLIFIDNNKEFSGYVINNWVNIKIAFYLEEIAKKGVIIIK